MNFESTRNFTKDGDRFFPIGAGDDYPRDESECNSHECIPDHCYKGEGRGWSTNPLVSGGMGSSGREGKPCCGYFLVRARQIQRRVCRKANPDTPSAASSLALRILRNVFQKISNEDSPSRSIPRRGGSCEAMIWIADPVTNPPTAGAGMNSTNQPSLSAPRRKITTPWKRKALSAARRANYCVAHA